MNSSFSRSGTCGYTFHLFHRELRSIHPSSFIIEALQSVVSSCDHKYIDLKSVQLENHELSF